MDLDLAAFIVAVAAFVTSAASAFYARRQATAAREANDLVAGWKKARIRITQNWWYKPKQPPVPGEMKYSAFAPRTVSRDQFTESQMYLVLELDILNEGPGRCNWLKTEITSREDARFRSTSQPTGGIAAGETVHLELDRLCRWEIPTDLVLTVEWRDESGEHLSREFTQDIGGKFVGEGMEVGSSLN